MTVWSGMGRRTGGRAIVKRCSHRGLWQHMRQLADRQSVADISPVMEPRFPRECKATEKGVQDREKQWGIGWPDFLGSIQSEEQRDGNRRLHR